MKNKSFVIAVMILTIGVITLFGTSYSMISNTLVSDESYGFTVADFDVEFQDNTKISLSGLPTSDEDGMNNSKEFTFTVLNNSDFDVNYRIDIIENSPYAMNKVIKYSYRLNDGQYQDIRVLSDNYTINQNKVLKAKEKDVYKIKLWLSIDADETYMNKKFQATISLFATHNENKYATNVIENLGNKNMDGVLKIDNEYRYTSADKNYVWFNCLENYSKGEDYCEKWQIIGSFNKSMEKQEMEYPTLKLIYNDVVEELTFNNEDLKGNYSDSYIKSYANGAYYDKLNKNAQELIINTDWNIGSTNSQNYIDALKEERKEKTYANIGLISVSDYLAIKDSVWFNVEKPIFTLNKNGDMVNIIASDGLKTLEGKKEAGFMPVVYLRADISIISGDGTNDYPYELGIKYPMNFGKVR